jgi:hypothetical protein
MQVLLSYRKKTYTGNNFSHAAFVLLYVRDRLTDAVWKGASGITLYGGLQAVQSLVFLPGCTFPDKDLMLS